MASALFFTQIDPIKGQNADNSRFIEVTGSASRAVLADEYFFKLSVIGASACNIPKKGRNWEKELKDCEEKNNELIVTREKVLDAVILTMSDKIEKQEAENSYDQSSKSFSCKSFLDFEKLKSTLLDADPNGYRFSMESARVDDRENIQSELIYEALKNTREKAVKMAAVLSVSVGDPIQISDADPKGNGSFFQEIMEMEMRKTQKGAWMPDNEGRIVFKKEVYVRFALK